MLVFRISSSKYIRDLSGTGAKINGGRWNSVGNALIYTAENTSLAAWEVFVNIKNEKPPSDLQVASIEIPDSILIKKLLLSDLPDDWTNPVMPQILAKIGDDWLASLETPVLQVPSAVVQNESNFLLNPVHPDFSEIKIVAVAPFKFDPRSLKNI